MGEIPAGFPSLEWPAVSWGELSSLIGPALGIAVVGYSDVVLTGRSFATRHDDEIDANQELLALGITNAGSGLTQGFPVSSSASRTVIGDAVGGRTPLTGLAVVVSVVLVLVFLRPLLAEFPQAALGALVIYAAIRLIDIAEFRRLARFRKSELALALATVAGVLLVDILYGVLIAVALVGARPVPAGRPTSRRGARHRARPARSARHRGLPRRHDRARLDHLPLRRAVVLRQRRGLPPTGPGHRRLRSITPSNGS